DARDGCVNEGRDEADKQSAQTQSREVMASARRNGADAGELEADRGEIREAVRFDAHEKSRGRKQPAEQFREREVVGPCAEINMQVREAGFDAAENGI